MQTNTLNGTDLRVSRACLGTMTFGGQTDQANAQRMVDRCIDRGVNFFDTANVYTGGESERLLGETLGRRRRQIVLASKAGMKVGDQPPGLSRAAILSAIEGSLQRLQTDYLDIYYMHLPDWNVPLEESLEAMETLVKQGKVRYAASSNFASWQLDKMHWIAERSGYAPTRIVQPMYNLLARRIEDEFLPACKDLGIATVVYNPLAGGILTGKQAAGAPLPGTRFDGNQAYLDRYWHQLNFEVVQQLSGEAAKAGRSLVSVALNWLLHHTPIDCVILGASRMEQLEENLDALEHGPLPAELLAECDAVWNRIKGPSPKYNR